MHEQLTAKAYPRPITAKVQNMQKVQPLQSLPNPILIMVLAYFVHILPKIELLRLLVEFFINQHVMVLFACPIVEELGLLIFLDWFFLCWRGEEIEVGLLAGGFLHLL